MPEKFPYNLEKAQKEMAKMKKLVGEKGEKEDYNTAEKLLEEAGEIEKVELSDEDGIVKTQIKRTTPLAPKEYMERKEPKPYVYKEIDRLGEELINFKRRARETRSEEEQKVCEEKIKFFREELEKAKKARDRIKEKIESRKSKFERLLKNKFDEFKAGSWESTIPEIESIQIYKSNLNKDGKLIVNVIWVKENKEHSARFKLLESGLLIGGIPRDRGLNIDKDELYDDVLHIVETINMPFFEYLDEKVLLPNVTGLSKERIFQRKQKEKKEDEEKYNTDPRHIQFMTNQKRVLFGFTDKETGFTNYYGFVFPKFFVLENEKIGNAAFFYNFKRPLDVDQKRFNLPPERRMTQAERKEILKKYIEQFLNSKKSQIVSMGAERKYHPHMDNKKWEERMQQEIDKRS